MSEGQRSGWYRGTQVCSVKLPPELLKATQDSRVLRDLGVDQARPLRTAKTQSLAEKMAKHRRGFQFELTGLGRGEVVTPILPQPGHAQEFQENSYLYTKSLEMQDAIVRSMVEGSAPEERKALCTRMSGEYLSSVALNQWFGDVKKRDPYLYMRIIFVLDSVCDQPGSSALAVGKLFEHGGLLSGQHHTVRDLFTYGLEGAGVLPNPEDTAAVGKFKRKCEKIRARFEAVKPHMVELTKVADDLKQRKKSDYTRADKATLKKKEKVVRDVRDAVYGEYVLKGRNPAAKLKRIVASAQEAVDDKVTRRQLTMNVFAGLWRCVKAIVNVVSGRSDTRVALDHALTLPFHKVSMSGRQSLPEPVRENRAGF